MVACIHPSGVRFPGAPLSCPQIENRSRGSRSRGSLKASPVGAATAARCRGSAHVAAHALGRAWWCGSAVSRVRRVRLPSRALRLVVAQRMEHHPATVGDGGSNPPGEIPYDRQRSAVAAAKRRLQGSPRRRRGSERRDRCGPRSRTSPDDGADWVGAALIRRSSVVRFHGRRSPRSSAEEQRASTPRVAGSSPAGEQELLVVGEIGHPTDFGRRRSQVRILPTRSSLS